MEYLNLDYALSACECILSAFCSISRALPFCFTLFLLFDYPFISFGKSTSKFSFTFSYILQIIFSYNIIIIIIIIIYIIMPKIKTVNFCEFQNDLRKSKFINDIKLVVTEKLK